VGVDVQQVAAFLGDSLIWTGIKIAASLLLLALLDYGFQWWRQEQDLRMTTQEVREEMKNLQGDPQIIARRRAAQRQLVLNRVKSTVPKADVVITNPTELAIAVQYDAEKMAAPVVVAKGAGVLAARIRKLALENGVPIVEKKPLAQLLYKEVEINQPIPAKMYAAVAEILAYVYQLKGKKMPS
ncbi:MAG: EscU/YscU/HrcU family type III secretion system export apparatus switch protein, partial [Pirellulales bacterium]